RSSPYSWHTLATTGQTTRGTPSSALPRQETCPPRGAAAKPWPMRWLIAFSVLGLLPSCSHKDDPLAAKLSTVEGFCDEWGSRACTDTVVMFCSAENKTSCIDSQRTFCESLIPDGKYSDKTARDCLGAVQDAYKDGILTATERDTVRKLANQCDKIVSGSG